MVRPGAQRAAFSAHVGWRPPGQHGTHPAERPAPFAPLFRDLRQFLRLSPEQVAMRLGTHPRVVLALELGRLQDLPPWPETARVVSAYTGLAQIDPMPMLQCVARCYQAAALPAPPKPRRRLRGPSPRRLASAVVGRGRAMLSGTTAAFADVGRGISAHPWLRLMLALGFSAAFFLIVTQTTLLEASVSKLPQPLAQMVRSTQDYMLQQFAPVRDGLRWIEVDDPRTRRTDKLQTGRR